MRCVLFGAGGHPASIRARMRCVLFGALFSCCVVPHAFSDCLMRGCDQGRTFGLGLGPVPAPPLPAPSRPFEVRWRRALPTQGAPETVRCISVLTKVVCAVERSVAASVKAASAPGLVAFDAGTGADIFSDRQLSSVPSYPTVIANEIVVVDGHFMAGVLFDGTPTGDPIPLELGRVYAPAPTDNGAILFLCKAGRLVAYLADGVPHASASVPGVPLAPLAVIGSRAFLLLQPSGVDRTLCIVVAFDVHRTLNNRIELAWRSARLDCPAAQGGDDPPPVMADSFGSVYVATTGCPGQPNDAPGLVALDPATGSVRWCTKFPGNAAAAVSGLALAPGGGLLAVMGNRPVLNLLNRSDGALLWETKLGPPIVPWLPANHTELAFAGGEFVLTVGLAAQSANGSLGLAALDPSAGRLLWTAPLSWRTSGAPTQITAVDNDPADPRLIVTVGDVVFGLGLQGGAGT